MIPLIIDASNIAYFIATTLDNYGLVESCLHQEALLTYVHERHWLTSGFPVAPIWVMDSKPYWRSEIEPEYKAQRSLLEKPLNVAPILNKLRELNFPHIAIPTFEADDIAAALVSNLKYDRAYLLTSDSDWMGLINSKVTVLSPTFQPHIRNKPEVWAWLYQRCMKAPKREQWLFSLPDIHHFSPAMIWQYKAAVGDAGDNLPASTPLCLIDLLNPGFGDIGKIDLEELSSLYKKANPKPVAWDLERSQQFGRLLPDVPFTPIRIGF